LTKAAVGNDRDWLAGNDPFLTVAFLQSGQSGKSRYPELGDYKAAVVDLNQSAILRLQVAEKHGSQAAGLGCEADFYVRIKYFTRLPFL